MQPDICNFTEPLVLSRLFVPASSVDKTVSLYPHAWLLWDCDHSSVGTIREMNLRSSSSSLGEILMYYKKYNDDLLTLMMHFSVDHNHEGKRSRRVVNTIT